jgi:serine/threonine-protein kinase
MAVLGAAVFVAGGAVPASAASALSVVSWQNVGTTNCLDSNYNGDVYSLPCNGGNYQNWNVYLASGGLTIVDAQTGRCLDSNYNGDVYSLPCNGGNYQNWNLSPSTSGGVYIQNAQTGLCLGDWFGNIYTWSCSSWSVRYLAWNV